MKLTRTSQLVLVAGLMASLFSGTNTAMAQTRGYAQVSYEIKYSELFPEQAESIRQRMRAEKDRIEAGIRNALNRGDRQEANRLATAGRARMQSLTDQVKKHCVSTTIVMHDTASLEDLEKAKQDLRNGRSPLGTALHVRGNQTGGGAGGGGSARPLPRPLPRPRPRPRPRPQPQPTPQPVRRPQPSPSPTPRPIHNPNNPNIPNGADIIGGSSPFGF